VIRLLAGLGASILIAVPAFGQGSAAPPPAQSPPPVFSSTVTVTGTLPLPGVDLPLGELPAPVQSATTREIDQSRALDVSAFLNKRLTGVHVNEIQGNPFQADVNYRGYTASPLLGTPQGLSVYMDGMRLNQPFGDVVSWDLIPRSAIASITMMPGSNPLFGLNTLGGALAIQTKDGKRHPGTSIQGIYGSSVRRAIEIEHGGSRQGFNWFVAGNVFGERGWRADSPSDVRQIFGKLGWTRGPADLAITFGGAGNSLTGNGLQERRFLDRDYASIYTKPDITDNRSAFVNLSLRRRVRDRVVFAANAYYRRLRTDTTNGDLNDDSLDQAIYQPGAAERAALAAAGYTGVPVSGASAENTPFPFWRCLGNVLLRDEPAEKCNALINRTASRQRNGGASAQATFLSGDARTRSQLTMGGALDLSGTDFQQSAELGYLNADRSVTGTRAFADGVTGGDVDGEPFDSRVDLGGRSTTVSAYLSETLTLWQRWHLTLAGRVNRTRIQNDDRIRPGGGPSSLDGDHTFSRFNPSAGMTVDLPRGLNAYGGYSEASRAPTSIELGCANPDQPCKLPNALAGDPPLHQIIARTWEAGVRGGGAIGWTAGVFRANNDDDVLFVTSEQTGFGYFNNFGQTRRLGAELSLNGRLGKAQFGSSYTLLHATYETAERVNGAGNSANDSAIAGTRGVEGVIEIAPGDQIPLIPRHTFKAFVDLELRPDLSVDADVTASSGSWARGNENNAHQPDGTYYLGDGRTRPYGILNTGIRYRLHKRVEVFAQLNNVLDTRYDSAAQLGSTGLTDAMTFIARPLPAVNGVFPLRNTTFYAPGSPRTFVMGTRLRF
jgi:outer membrane receptor protein involved in Fe transport